MDYYDTMASGYDELHREEQARKFNLVFKKINIDPSSLVLDVGCGTGLLQEHTRSRIVGIDPAVELLKIAGNRLFQVAAGTAENLPFKNKCFDIVVAMTSVHNFHDYEKGLVEIERVCKFLAVISILKKSKKYDEIILRIPEIFDIWEQESIGEDLHDLIFIMRKK